MEDMMNAFLLMLNHMVDTPVTPHIAEDAAEGTEDETDECDACGEVKPTEGGEVIQIGTIWAGAIDPPDYQFICADCQALHEDMEVDRAEARADNYGEYPPGYDGR